MYTPEQMSLQGFEEVAPSASKLQLPSGVEHARECSTTFEVVSLPDKHIQQTMSVPTHIELLLHYWLYKCRLLLLRQAKYHEEQNDIPEN